MKIKKIVTAALLSAVFSNSILAADSIAVGVIGGKEEQVAEMAKKVAKEKFDLDVKLIVFNDYVAPNAALDAGDIDLNAMQHKPYLDGQIRDRGYKLSIVGNTFVYPIVGYSKKIKNISQLKDGAVIGIPNDPTNEGRALLLLEKQGVIKLAKNAGLEATPLDIVENPKNIEFKELEAPQLPRAIDDLDLAIINNSYASNAGLSYALNGVFVEAKESPYVNIIVSREDNKDTKAVKEFVEAFQTEAVYNEAQRLFGIDGVVKGWK